MKKRLIIGFFLCICSLQLSAQNKAIDKEIVEIKRVLFENGMSLEEDRDRTFLFSIKVRFAQNCKIDTIFASKYMPRQLVKGMTSSQNYSKVNWRNLVGREIAEGEIIIIPFGFYYTSSNVSVFNSYVIDELFTFGDGNTKVYGPVTVLNPVVLHGSMIRN